MGVAVARIFPQPTSASDQKRKFSPRAHVVRFTPESRHLRAISASPLGAKRRHSRLPHVCRLRDSTVTVCGRVKGTIRAVRVKLQNGGAVEGDIFHKSLSIDENSLFEGSSRRVENPTDPSSGVSKKDILSQVPIQSSSIGADLH